MQNRKRLFIIGASGLGREVENCLYTIPEEDRDWDLIGFLHSFEGKSPLEGYPSRLHILGEWENYRFGKNDYCIIAVGDCNWREKIYNHLKEKVNFYTFIHPSTAVYDFSTIAEASLIMPNCFISTDVRIGNACFLNVGTQVGHDVKIGNFTSIMSQVEISGWCNIGEKVFIGSKSVIISKTKIEDESKVGAGSVVIKKVKKNTTVFGNPAIRIK